MSARRVLPGFRLSLGLAVTYLSLLVLLPLGVLLLRAASIGPAEFVAAATTPRALSAYGLSLGTAFAAAAINTVFGVLVAWVLVRYDFPGRRLVDAAIDLPFALPTAVGGIALVTLYAPDGPLGRVLGAFGLKVAYAPLGVVVALVFVGLPFVVRCVAPVLADFEREQEEAAATLGASRLVVLRRVVLPALLPAALTGFALSFARAIGEYGSVVFISGNLPFRTEVAPFLVMTKLEQYDYDGATSVAVVMLAASFLLLFGINRLERWTRQLQGSEVA
jgi:sulfate transport system permease protein